MFYNLKCMKKNEWYWNTSVIWNTSIIWNTSVIWNLCSLSHFQEELLQYQNIYHWLYLKSRSEKKRVHNFIIALKQLLPKQQLTCTTNICQNRVHNFTKELRPKKNKIMHLKWSFMACTWLRRWGVGLGFLSRPSFISFHSIWGRFTLGWSSSFICLFYLQRVMLCVTLVNK